MKLQIEILFSYHCDHCRKVVIRNDAAIPALGGKVKCPHCGELNTVQMITSTSLPPGQEIILAQKGEPEADAEQTQN